MVGTGYLLWSPQTVLMTPMPQIELALRGHVKYLRLINGAPDDDPNEINMRPADGPGGLGDYLRRRARGG